MAFEQLNDFQLYSATATESMRRAFGVTPDILPSELRAEIARRDPDAAAVIEDYGVLRHPTKLANGAIGYMAIAAAGREIKRGAISSLGIAGTDLGNFGTWNENIGEQRADNLLGIVGYELATSARVGLHKSDDHKSDRRSTNEHTTILVNPRGDDYRIMMADVPGSQLDLIGMRVLMGAFNNDKGPEDQESLREIIMRELPNLPKFSKKTDARGVQTEGRRLGASLSTLYIDEAAVSNYGDDLPEYVDQFTDPKINKVGSVDVIYQPGDSKRMVVDLSSHRPSRFGAGFSQILTLGDRPGIIEDFPKPLEELFDTFKRAQNS